MFAYGTPRVGVLVGCGTDVSVKIGATVVGGRIVGVGVFAGGLGPLPGVLVNAGPSSGVGVKVSVTRRRVAVGVGVGVGVKVGVGVSVSVAVAVGVKVAVGVSVAGIRVGVAVLVGGTTVTVLVSVGVGVATSPGAATTNAPLQMSSKITRPAAIPRILLRLCRWRA